MENTEITVLETEESKKLSKEVAKDLRISFEPLLKQAQEWKTKADGLVVKDASDTKTMELAREARLELKNIRVQAEKTKDALKADALLKNKAIDGMFNIIKFLIVPIEQKLEEQEKFIELQETKRLDELQAKRVEELSQYVEDMSAFNVRTMPDETYNNLLADAKRGYEARQQLAREAEEKEAEELRLKEVFRQRNSRLNQVSELIQLWDINDISLSDKLARIDSVTNMSDEEFEREFLAFQSQVTDVVNKMKAENARLKKEAEEKAIADQKARKIEEEKQAKIKAERDAKELKERQEYAVKLKKINDENLRLQQEARAKKEAEEKKQKEIAAEEKRKQTAPDREKLAALADTFLRLDYPEMKSEEGKKLIAQIKTLAMKVNVYIVENIKNL